MLLNSMSAYQLDTLVSKGGSAGVFVIRYIKLWLKVMLMGYWLTGVSVPAIDQTDVLRRDFNTMMGWLEGEFDNIEQVYFSGVLGVDEASRPDRLHRIIQRVAVPVLGDMVFYVTQYRDNDPDKITSRHLYHFTPDFEQFLIVQKRYDLDAGVNVPISDEDFAALTLNDLKDRPDGCDILWRRRADQFIGAERAGPCAPQAGSSIADDADRVDLILSEDEMWMDGRLMGRDGKASKGYNIGVTYKFMKQQTFTCWVFARDEGSERGGVFKDGLKISDQGGEIWVPLSEQGKKVGIKMRHVRWPYGNNRNSLVLYAHNDDSGNAVAYAWTEPDGERIALNLRWIQASCSKNN